MRRERGPNVCTAWHECRRIYASATHGSARRCASKCIFSCSILQQHLYRMSRLWCIHHECVCLCVSSTQRGFFFMCAYCACLVYVDRGAVTRIGARKVKRSDSTDSNGELNSFTLYTLPSYIQLCRGCTRYIHSIAQTGNKLLNHV